MRFKFIYLFFLPSLLFAKAGYFEPWGKDCDLKVPAQEEVVIPRKSSLAAKAAELAINFHQNVISPVDGPRSHFRPSSSEYMRLAIRRHGFIKGYIMGCDRLLRENDAPWHYRTIEENGKLFKWDPPPE